MKYRTLVLAIYFLLVTFQVQAHTMNYPHDDFAQLQEVEQELQMTSQDFLDVPFFAQKNDYALPYPGILPDHPLYFIKKLRDGLLESLIVDPVKKTEFYLLQSDKFLAMAATFSQKKQSAQALQSALNSLAKFQKAAEQREKFKQTADVPGYLKEKFALSANKRLELFIQFRSSVSEEDKKFWDTLVGQANQFAIENNN